MHRWTNFSVVAVTFGLSLGVSVLSGCGVFFPGSGKEDSGPVITGPWTLHAPRVDTVGYIVGRAKQATVVLPQGMTTLADTTAELRSVATNEVVWPCTVTGPMTDPETNVIYYVADFTPFDEPGEYYVNIPAITPAVGKSANFRVGPDVFRDALKRSVLSFYGQRCGTAVSISISGTTWAHAACHSQDAYQSHVASVATETIKPSMRGWHDAGDFGKYVTNGAFTVGMMLDAWQHFTPALNAMTLPIPESGGAFPDYLDEIKWELDWLLTTQWPDGGVSHKVTAPSFEGFVMPEQDGGRRYYTDVGTSATADFVAVMAEASRIYRPYDAALADQYLLAAQQGWAFLDAHPTRIFPRENFETGAYGDDNDSGERLWAAAELWETTGEAVYLTYFENKIWDGAAIRQGQGVVSNFDWADARNLGLFAYLMSARDSRTPAVVTALTATAVSAADGTVTISQLAAFGRGSSGYYWGSNGTVARTAMTLWVANTLSPKPAYLDTIAAQVDHLLGRNYYDRSQVTAVGYHPPLRPHHRPSAADSVFDPWPGLLVGGANQQRQTATLKPAMTWVDEADDASLNENAINWNGALVYALAALTPGP